MAPNFKVVAVNIDESDADLVAKLGRVLGVDLLTGTKIEAEPAVEAEPDTEGFDPFIEEEPVEEITTWNVGDVVDEDENDLRFKKRIYVGNPVRGLIVQELFGTATDKPGIWVLVEGEETDQEFSFIFPNTDPQRNSAEYDEVSGTLTLRAYKVPEVKTEPGRDIPVNGFDSQDENDGLCGCDECVAERENE